MNKFNFSAPNNFFCSLFFAFGLVIHFSSAESLAQSMEAMTTANSSSFDSLILEAVKTCKNLRCEDSSVRAKILSKSELGELSADNLKKITLACQEIAEIEWPETILDGPYVASFKIQISRVEALIHLNKRIGFRVTYVDQAWETENCKYNPEKPNTLSECKPGLFVESAFISASTGEAFRDPNSVVEFIPKK